MPISLANIHDELLPGLMAVREALDAGMFASFPGGLIDEAVFRVNAPALDFLPAISLPTAVALGVAAVVVKNPTVSRRGLFGWFAE